MFGLFKPFNGNQLKYKQLPPGLNWYESPGYNLTVSGKVIVAELLTSTNTQVESIQPVASWATAK
jgi:hypothetical protein